MLNKDAENKTKHIYVVLKMVEVHLQFFCLKNETYENFFHSFSSFWEMGSKHYSIKDEALKADEK